MERNPLQQVQGYVSLEPSESQPEWDAKAQVVPEVVARREFAVNDAGANEDP